MCEFRIQPEKPCRQLVPLACPHCSRRSFLLSDIMQYPGPDPGSAVFPRTLGSFSGSPFMLQLEGPAADTLGCDGGRGLLPHPQQEAVAGFHPRWPPWDTFAPRRAGDLPGASPPPEQRSLLVTKALCLTALLLLFSGDLKSPAYLFCFTLIPVLLYRTICCRSDC